MAANGKLAKKAEAKDTSFTGTIKVAARIIDYLSSGLYHTPGACLKELINNSYDAGAKKVSVFVKPDAGRIIIEDDGDGMTQEDFVKHFDHISESHKRDNDETIEFGRKKIGKIGIGFIAANEICDCMELYSTKRGSTDLLHITINFSEMRKTPEERRVSNSSEFVKADYVGELLSCLSEEHFTKLFLTSVRGRAQEILAGAQRAAPNDPGKARSLYGLSADSVAEILGSGNVRTWREFDAYSETMLQVGLNIPVRYHEDWMPARLSKKVKRLVAEIESLNFEVQYDGADLRKPIIFHPESKALIDVFNFKGKYVEASGYFYAQHGTIAPPELHGLMVRIRHAAVGEYDPQFWGFPPTEASIIQRWVSAEINADDRLEDAMNIDRRTLRVAHPAYVELQVAIHDHLRRVLGRARKELYSETREVRRPEKRWTACSPCSKCQTMRFRR